MELILDSALKLWESYTISQLIWTSAGLVLFLFALIRGCQRGNIHDSEEQISHRLSIQSFTACDFPNCVRCNKYRELLDKATDRLFQYIEVSKNVDPIQKVINTFKTNHYAREDTDIPPGDQRPNVYFLPGLTATPVWTAKPFEKDLQLICSSIASIWKEYRQVCAQMDSRWSVNTTPTGIWSVFYFINQGQRVKVNCDACPMTMSVLDKLPSFMGNCAFSNAGFSVIYPGTDIEEHYGPTNIRIRCHIGNKLFNFLLISVKRLKKVP